MIDKWIAENNGLISFLLAVVVEPVLSLITSGQIVTWQGAAVAISAALANYLTSDKSLAHGEKKGFDAGYDAAKAKTDF